jgi:sodium-independent sulfate anion transporter 11
MGRSFGGGQSSIESDLETVYSRLFQFHFANLLSPWIRRALVAGGFGIGIPAAGMAEIAAVVPYRGGASNVDGIDPAVDDAEGQEIKKHKDRSHKENPENPALVSTPFFHIDLAGAVAAAEAGVSNISRAGNPKAYAHSES